MISQSCTSSFSSSQEKEKGGKRKHQKTESNPYKWGFNFQPIHVENTDPEGKSKGLDTIQLIYISKLCRSQVAVWFGYTDIASGVSTIASTDENSNSATGCKHRV